MEKGLLKLLPGMSEVSVARKKNWLEKYMESKKKGIGEASICDHVLLYSGVGQQERAKHGVGCLFHKNLIPNIKNWKAVD